MTGFVAPGYEVVEEVFAADPRGGSALCVLRHGEVVVDLREGWADAKSLVNVFSVGKPVIALAVLILVDRKLIGLDEPVARYWPGFKTDASVRSLLTHTAGLIKFPVPRDVSAWADWDLLCGDLAAAAPEWPPGTVAAEHGLTYGHLLGELVRRVDGRPPGEFVSQEIALPWRLDFGFGLDRADLDRCADLIYDKPERRALMLGEEGTVRAGAVANPPGMGELPVLNSELWRTSVVPAVNLHSTAEAVARFYAGLLAGGVLAGHRLLSEPLTREMVASQFRGFDHFIGREVTWGLGVQLESDGTWGMGGVGGSAGWADPARGHAIGYVTRRLGNFERVDALDTAISAV